MLALALQPPQKLNFIPYTSGTLNETSMMISLLLRPLVVPAIPGRSRNEINGNLLSFSR
jgi:hypothetical protein